MWAIVDWSRIYGTGKPSAYPMQYVALIVDGRPVRGGDPRSAVTRGEIQHQTRAILTAGGYELWGIAIAVLKLAADQPSLPHDVRGYLTNHLQQPLTTAEVAELLGLTTQRTRWALDRLKSPQIRFLDLRDWTQAWSEIAARRGPQDDRQPAEMPEASGPRDVRTRTPSRDASDLPLPGDQADGADRYQSVGANDAGHGAAEFPVDMGGSRSPDRPEAGDARAGPDPGGEKRGTFAAAAQDEEEERRGRRRATSLAACGSGCPAEKREEAAEAADEGAPTVDGRGDAQGEGGQETTPAQPTPPQKKPPQKKAAEVEAAATEAAAAEAAPAEAGRHGCRPPAGTGPGGAGSATTSPSRPDQQPPHAVGGPKPAACPRGPAHPPQPQQVAHETTPAGTGPGGAGDAAASPARPDSSAPAGAVDIEIEGDQVRVIEHAIPDAELWGDLIEMIGLCWRMVHADASGRKFGLAVYSLMGWPRTNQRDLNRQIGAVCKKWQALRAKDLGEAAELELCEKGLRKALDLRQQRHQAAWTKDKKAEPHWWPIWMTTWDKRVAKWIRERPAK